MTIMGRPDSVWRLTSVLWNLCVRYPLGFPKADLVRRLFATVRRLIAAQKSKQRLAINKAPGYNLVRVKEARLQFGSGAKTRQYDPNQLPERRRGSRFDSCQVVPLYYIGRNK